MEWKEFLKEQMKKVDNQEDKGARLGIYLNEDTKFLYHKNCFADMHEDFMIVYDKNTGANMAIPYKNIVMTQYMTDEILEKQSKELGFEDFLKKLLED